MRKNLCCCYSTLACVDTPSSETIASLDLHIHPHRSMHHQSIGNSFTARQDLQRLDGQDVRTLMRAPDLCLGQKRLLLVGATTSKPFVS